jgi:hypothetical protein
VAHARFPGRLIGGAVNIVLLRKEKQRRQHP